ncbi:MAG: hypothetical protein KGM18_08920, partial [Sphingomonadales bacterium]|nr:hypothetical protein [Sphingomonadales bacterium]
LMTLSIFERFNGDLLNHLGGKHDGWDFIDKCVRQGLLMAPLDAEGRWYTLHRLFREFLIERWKRIDAKAIAETHRRAARWFRDEGLVREAIRHADLGSDTALVTDILTEAGGWLAALHGGPALMKIIADLPQDVLAKDPSLRLGHVYLLIQDGELPAARKMINELRQSVTADGHATFDNHTFFDLSVETLDSLLQSYEGHILRPDTLLALKENYSFTIPLELDALINNIIGYFYLSNGDIRSAVKFGRLVADNKSGRNVEFVEAYTNLWLTQAYLDLGEIGNAEHRIEFAIAMSDRNFGTESAPAIAGRVFQCELLFEQDDLAPARTQLFAQIPKIGLNDQWFNVYATAYRVGSEIALLEQGPEATLAFLKDVAAALSANELQKMASYLDLLRADALVTAGRDDEARRILEQPATPLNAEERAVTSSTYMVRTIAEIRLDMAAGNHEAACARLSDLAERLDEAGSRRGLVTINTLLATCCLALGDGERAAALASEAADLARECGLKGTFRLARLIQPGLWSDPRIAARVNLGAEPVSVPTIARPAVPATSPALPGLRFGPREQEVLTYLLDGMTSKEIARATGLAIGTVLSHRKSIYRKLGVNSRSAAIAAARSLNAPSAG